MADTPSEGRIWSLAKSVSPVAKRERYNRKFMLRTIGLVLGGVVSVPRVVPIALTQESTDARSERTIVEPNDNKPSQDGFTARTSGPFPEPKGGISRLPCK